MRGHDTILQQTLGDTQKPTLTPFPRYGRRPSCTVCVGGQAAAQMKKVDAANAKIRMLFARDVALFPGATAGGAALLMANPPGVVLNEAQKRSESRISVAIAPAKGWPKDVRMDIRVMGYSGSARA